MLHVCVRSRLLVHDHRFGSDPIQSDVVVIAKIIKQQRTIN